MPTGQIIKQSDASILAPRVDTLETDLTLEVAARLTDKADNALQLATKAKIDVVNAQIANVVSGTPRTTYSTLALLTAGIPDGNIYSYVTSDGHRYWWDGSAWIDGGLYQSSGIAEKSILPKNLDRPYVTGANSKNLFDKTLGIPGYYVNNTTGNLSINVLYTSSDYIPISPSTAYRISGTAQQGAFYTASKVYISGFPHIVAFNSVNTPANAAYVRLSCFTTEINAVQLELGTAVTSYLSYGAKLYTSDIQDIQDLIPPDTTITINVKPDGTGDFLNPVLATRGITDSSKDKIYNIYIHEGIYDIMTYLDAAELVSSAQGWVLPDYVNLIGVGEKDKIILKGDYLGADANFVLYHSTLNVKKSNRLENLIITAKNLRYAVHDESANLYKDWNRFCKTCDFIHYGNTAGFWQYTAAWGEGCSSGSHSEFEDCLIQSVGNGAAWLTHNNLNFTAPTFHKFNRCKIINKDYNIAAMRFGSMGSGVRNLVELIGCDISGPINFRREFDGTGYPASAEKSEFELSGYGNSLITYEYDTTEFSYSLNEETRLARNVSGATITRGTPIKLDTYGGITPMVNGDSQNLFDGLTFETFLNNSSGIIKYAGYVKLEDIALVAVAGDKVTITNGAFVVTTGSDYIGVVKTNGYMKLL